MNLNLTTYFTQTIPEMSKKMSRCDFSIGSAHLVQVTHVNSPSSFYVRLSCLRFSLKLLEVPGAPLPLSEVVVNKKIVYKSKTINRFIRGSIEKVFKADKEEELFCTVMAVDIGCVDNYVVLKDMFLPKSASLQCVPLAIHCQLNECEPLGDLFDREAVQAMKYIVERNISTMFIKCKYDDKFKVELRPIECRQDVSTMLRFLSFTTFYRLYSRMFLMPPQYRYKHRQYKAGDMVHARVLSGSSMLNFYVADVTDYDAYDNVIGWYEFTKYCMDQPDLDVVAASQDGRACGVKVFNPERYERAVVKRVAEMRSKAVVQLIDWGKELEVNHSDIKPVTDTHLERPAMAIYCTADAMQCMNNGVPSIHTGLEFLMEVLSPGTGFRIPNRVKIYRIANANQPRNLYDRHDSSDEDDGAE